MPYSSDAQRKFFHTDTAKKAGITGAEVKEFDKASKGKELPEHVKKMADGGITSGNPADLDPGVKDATTSDFLLPFLLGPAATEAGAEAPAMLKGLGEAGEVTLGRNAPAMEEATDAVSPKVEAFIKGIQKSPNGNEVKIWGVRGDPDEISKLGYGSDPASVPEHILRAKGVLTEQVNIPQNAPNAYADGGMVDNLKKLFGGDKSDAAQADAIDPVVTPSTDTAKVHPTNGSAEGGKVERSSLAHPTPNGMMARAMDKGGYPHVTFMEDETPEEVKTTTHMASLPPKMAEGGTVHKAEERDKEPAKPKDIDMSHEKKLSSIYKAMGIKKYDDGGTVDEGDVDPSQLPTPNANDPTYWDQVKAALAKFSNSPAATIAGAAANPVGAATDAITGAAPSILKAELPAVSGVANAVTGGAIPAVPPTPPAVPTVPPAQQNMPPTVLSPLAQATTTPTVSNTTGAGMPNIGNLFNQDTSKLTEGVNPEDRQALVQKLQDQQKGLGAIIAQAVAGLGDAFAARGGKEQHSLQNIFSMEKTQRDEALANFDAARQERIQKLSLQTQMGNNAINQAAAADAYGVDENLNKLMGAPKGTMKKDLPNYMSLLSSQIGAKEKDEDLYMKAHAQAGTDVDNAVKNASILNVKPSPAQLQASGSKLADQYYNRAKGNILVKPSDGGPAQWIPAQNLNKAKQMDPNLTVQQ